MYNTYNNQEIRELSDREKCRLKLPMYFGDRSNFSHSLRETLANSRDEIINNFDSGEIYVKLYEDNQTVEILDTGRGLNLKGETNGSKNYYLLLEKLGAGGNHDNLKLGIASCGTNSVGLTTSNYCAELFEATSYKNHNFFKVNYKNGGILQNIEEGYDENIEHGTRIKFKQDKEVYNSITFDPNYIDLLLNKLSSTTNKIKYKFEYNGEVKEYFYDSYEDYVDNNVNNIVSNKIIFNEKSYSNQIRLDKKDYIEVNKLSILLSLSTEPMIETYLNGTYLSEHGSILDGIVEGLKKVFQKEVGKSKLTNNDIIMSFNIYCNFISTNPSFSGQTKFSSASPLYKKIATDYIVENMEIYKAENPQDFEKIVKHLQQINSFNSKNENAIKNIKKKLNTGGKILSKVKGLYECQSKDISKNVLCICEGKSALSGILENRPETCAILPIRGKILNCLKASPEKIVNCEIIASMINALGCGANLKLGKKTISKFNKENIRYSGLWLVCDADYDGIGSIVPLVLTVVYKLMPDLLLDGFVYICETPKYEIKFNDDTEDYAFDDNELRKKLENETRKYELHYVKGLAELSKTAMRRCLSGECNNIKQLSLNDAEKAIKELELWMGSDVEPRKQYILDNFDKGVVMGE